MKKTNFESYSNKKVCKGCQRCVKGEKLVLFLGGKCTRKCWYCSLSQNRKNSQKAYANERPLNKISDLIIEAKESNAKGAGITGGDPLIYFKEIKNYTKALKKKFGKSFHIHIYLPLLLVDEKKLKELKTLIDEVRFHPSFLINNNPELIQEEIKKIRTASKIFGKKNTGIELPCLPEKKNEILTFIEKISDSIGFCNLNEFEISETNFDNVTKNYTLNQDSYTIKDSINSGKWIIKKCEEKKINLVIHLCTARTKDNYQFINRLLRYNILPFGNKSKEGTVVYFAHYYNDLEKILKKISLITKNYHIDKPKKRIIIKMSDVEKVYRKIKIKIARVEEHPTFQSDYLEFSYIDE